MPLEYVSSQQGKPMLVYKGYMFLKEKEDEEKIIWKCSQYKIIKCPARVHTRLDAVVKETDHINYVPDPVKARVKSIISEIKNQASISQESTHRIIATATVGLTPAIQGQLPAVPNLKRTVQNVRHQATGALPNLRSLEDLVIPQEYQLLEAGQIFLQWDSGPGPNRILLFTTDRNLELLSQSRHWYADGTFKTTPPLFQQMYTIHGVHYHNVIPSIFALLPNKTEATYIRLLSKLKELRNDLNPTSIMTDFELAAINSFSQEFREADQRGCFFHLAQCVYRKLQALGLQERYQNDPDFGLQIRMIPALAFVPVPDVVGAFENLRNHLPAEARGLIDYFEETWISLLNRKGQRRQGSFSLEMWNCFESVLEDLPKTNNAVEGWHRSYLELVGAHHPTIFKFIKSLKKEQSLNETKIKQYIAGQLPPPGRRRYRDCAVGIKTIVSDYAHQDILDYLRGLAHNFDF